MTTTPMHPLAADYLKRLRSAARDLPRGRRDELAADIEAHLAEAAPPYASEGAARVALDRLGDPAGIVAEARGDLPAPRRRGAVEWSAIVLLLVGGIVIPFIGWVVGALLLWISQAWTVRDKLWGTLVLPGGLLPAAWLTLGATSVESCYQGPHGQVCTGGPSTAHRVAGVVLVVAALVLPFVTAVYLARRAQRPAAA